MPSSFGCSPGTYGDRRWTIELQKRLMICDPTADLITVRYAKPWRKSALHPVLTAEKVSSGSRAEVPDPFRVDCFPWQGDRTPRMSVPVARSDFATG